MSRAFSSQAWTVGLAVVLVMTAGANLTPGFGAAERENSSGKAAKSPVVIELFTSQGCSSCPPADRFLSELASSTDLEIVALSFHVDYWNYIGWTDPFSSSAWSDRQRRYARTFGGNRVYTPQMVVNGRWEGVGSNRAEISKLLERARSEAARAELVVSAELVADRLVVAVGTHLRESEVGPESLGLWVAIVENDLVTAVGRGENASKTLRNDRVVRHLEKAGGSGRPVGAGTSLEIALESGWRRDRLSVVAFLQGTDSLGIYGAAESAVTDST